MDDDAKELILEAMSTGTVDFLLISHGDGRITMHTEYDSQTTGEWLIRLGNSVINGEGWAVEP